MTATTTIRVTRTTRDTLNELASSRSESLSKTLERAVRLLRQEAVGRELSASLRDDELEWLDAEAG